MSDTVRGARTVACPFCGAEPGHRCRIRQPAGRLSKNLHDARIRAYRGQPRARIGPMRYTPLAGTLCMRSWDPADCTGFGVPQQHRCTQNRWVPHVCCCQSCAWDEADRCSTPAD